jgi:FtsP/CotA-like multicopper oxidase with cupredoxin domain
MSPRQPLAFLLLSFGCSGEPSAASQTQPDGQPGGWDNELAMSEAVDTNPDPRVVEVNLTAREAAIEILPGTLTPMWTYDGKLPGPLIRARVGDTLIVHFKNELPEPTTIHWHGLRIPVEMDGVPEHSQNVVPAGGSFDYSFTLPDAGLYWYHPHFDSATQVGRGLYGAIVVEDPAEAGLGDELVLVLSDLALEPDGSLQDTSISGDIGTLFGREGNVLLVNGRVAPTLKARSGKRQRWRIVNAAKSRYFQLALEDHEFLRIGSDGGLSEYPTQIARPVVIPGERLDLLLVPRGEGGSTAPVRWVPYDRGYGSTEFRPEETLFSVSFAESASPPEAFPEVTRPLSPLDLSVATLVDVEFTQDSAADRSLVLGINHVPMEQSEPFHGTVGETQIWTIFTEMQWSHPFHLHGFFFQVLDENGEPRRPLEWKDTVDVPYRSSVKVAVRYDERPGMWMFHCHILDHADAGMMGMLHLMP